MSEINILPTPVYLEIKSDRKVSVQINRAEKLPDILTDIEQERFKSHLVSGTFKREGYILRASQTGIAIYAESPAGFYHGQNTIIRLNKVSKDTIPELLILDYPTFAIRGFMEGYTGFPWTSDREEVIKVCAQHGFNTYVLGPNEFNLLSKWSERFPKAYREHLDSIAGVAHKNFVKFAYKIIPFRIDMSSSLDINSFKEKAHELADLGIDGIVIALDDYFKLQKKSKHAKTHARFANKVAEELIKRGVQLYFIPPIYYGINLKYHSTLGKELDSSVQVGWTGSKVVSPTITLEEVKTLEDLLKRKPFLGHNFPVVNETDKKRRINLGPLKGLDTNLYQHLNGIAFNFMPLPFASLISGLTCADYSWNPKDYNPNNSIHNSCLALGNTDLMTLVNLNPETSVDPNARHRIINAIVKGGTHWKFSDMSQIEKEQLKETFAAMSALEYSLLPPKIEEKLYQELKPFLYQANMIGGLGETIIDGTISRIGRFKRAFAGFKMVAGYRFSGIEIENWILREMGFPANLLIYMRSLADIKDRIYRGRHKPQ